MRLWVTRRFRSAPAAPASPDDESTPGSSAPARSRLRPALFGLVSAIIVVGALIAAFVLGRDNHGPGRGGASPLTASRQEAARWVASQVGHGSIVACDPAMCASLVADHFPRGNLLPITSSTTDPMGSAVIVATAPVRSQFGKQLPDVYAPDVLASFGRGSSRVDIRVEAPDGAAAYLVEQRADLLARQSTGRELLTNSALHVSAAARQVLRAGGADARLLYVLASLTHQVSGVTVIRFSPRAPGASPDLPSRMVQIDGVSATYLRTVRNYLGQQEPLYRPQISVLRPGPHSVIQLMFPAPSPFRLIGQ